MTEEELLNELTKEIYVERIKDNEITVRMLSIKLGINTNNARNILNSKVQTGELQKRLAINEFGYKVYAYSKIQNGNKL